MKTNSQSKAEEGKGVDYLISIVLDRIVGDECWDEGDIKDIIAACKSHYKAEAFKEIEAAIEKKYRERDKADYHTSIKDIREVFAKLREGL